MNVPKPFDFRAFHASHKVAMIVACSENGVIGSDGDLPWHLPEDLRHFMRSTRGCAVVMGRKTFESLHQPLLNRLIIVLSRSMKDDRTDGVRVAPGIQEAVEIAQASEMEGPVWIAGGGHIYRQAMDQVDLIVQTRVHAQIEGDTIFPEIDQDHWKRVHSQDIEQDSRHLFASTIEWWSRLCSTK
jgi:dihydrofolate reductase